MKRLRLVRQSLYMGPGKDALQYRLRALVEMLNKVEPRLDSELMRESLQFPDASQTFV